MIRTHVITCTYVLNVWCSVSVHAMYVRMESHGWMFEFMHDIDRPIGAYGTILDLEDGRDFPMKVAVLRNAWSSTVF